jgi:hypothetical protein
VALEHPLDLPLAAGGHTVRLRALRPTVRSTFALWALVAAVAELLHQAIQFLVAGGTVARDSVPECGHSPGLGTRACSPGCY